MRLITAKGEFKLPTNFKAESTVKNPLLSNYGDQTAPITLPATPHNLMLIDFSHRLDAFYKPVESMTVTVVTAFDVKPGRLVVHSASEADGISCTIYFNAAEFYAQIDKIDLQSLPWGEVKSPDFDTITADAKRFYLINLLKNEYNTLSSDVFKVVPVRTTTKMTWQVVKFSSSTNTNVLTNIESKFILNGFDIYGTGINFYGDNEVFLSDFFGEQDRLLVSNDAILTIKAGYGMTPFLLLNFVLKTIFENYGYHYTPHTTVMTRAFVLNNVADAIYEGVLKLWQLLPAVKVKDFLAEVERWYAGKFIVEEFSKEVSFVRYQERLNAYSDFDLTQYLTSKPSMQGTEFKNLIIDNTNDTIEPEQNATLDNETMSFAFKQSVNFAEDINVHEMREGYPNQCDTFTKRTMSMVETGDIVHKNSVEIVDNKIVSENKDDSTDILFSDYVPVYTAEFVEGATGNLTCRTSERFENHLTPGYSDVQKLQLWYQDYISMLKNSNIPIVAKFNIPRQILSKINITTPKKLMGQKVLIESIKTVLGEDSNDVEMQLRTLREFSNR